MKTLLAIAFAAIAAGCATPYAPNSFWNDGGFTETEIQPNVVQVRFQGNEMTSEKRAAHFENLFQKGWSKRSCLHNG